MKKMLQGQSGASLIGICFVVGTIGFFVLVGLKIFPVYNNYFKLKTVMEGVASIPKEQANKRKIVSSLLKRAYINDLKRFTGHAISKNKGFVEIFVDKKTKQKLLIIRYDESVRLFSNIYVTMKVRESIPLGENAVETTAIGDEQEK